MRAKAELRPYQNRIATDLYGYDERLVVARPGTGKTVGALTAIEELLTDGYIRHALVVAPKRVARAVWPDEIVLWQHTADLPYAVLAGTPHQRKAILNAWATRDITIIGIDSIEWLLDELVKMPADSPLFDLLVIDEISRLRNPKGKRANLIAKHAHRWKMVWGLSGTLRPSSAEDLFMPARVVTRNKLWGKSFYKWQREHFYPLDYQGYQWAPLPGHEAVINAEIAPHVTALRDDELPQLPELQIIFDKVELPETARAQYDTMQRKLFAEAGSRAVLASTAAIATGKLAQMANGFVYPGDGLALYIHDEKRAWLEEIIDSAVGPVLLVYEFLEDLRVLRELLGEDLPYLGDGVSDRQSDINIDRWNRGELPFMALHPASGGHGLNLQHGGSDMAWLSPTWNPESWEQTIARLHRSGQAKPVIVRVCVAEHTVDQMKLDRVHGKMTAQEAFERYLRDNCSV